MDSSSGGEKDGENSDALGSLHDHSDLLIPNSAFISSPGSVSSTSSSNMIVTSPPSIEHDLLQNMTSSHESTGCVEFGDFAVPLQQPDSSPPNVVVDDSPLQPCMDRNKESLKVKLLMRRPINQLVEQGILPPPTTPAAFAGQRVSLERARTRDSLKAKIQQRPARQELIRQHILEDIDTRVAPSLAEKQRRLKRARLADSLSDHLAHRPGPLELVQKNILHAPDENIDKAIKDGFVSFKATCEGHVPGPSLPNKYTTIEDDSSSDISSPAGTPDASSSGHTTEANTPLTKESSDSAISSLPSSTSCPPVPTIVPVSRNEPCEVSLQPAKTNKSEISMKAPPPPPPLPPPAQIILATPAALASSPLAQQQKITPTTIFQVTTATGASGIPPPPPLPPPQTIVLSDGAVRDLLPQLQSAGFQLAAAVQKSQPGLSSSSLGKSRSSKKSNKSKTQPKARTIKFHEYKGPSSCGQKGSAGGGGSATSSTSSSQSSAESSYELLLKQQQLFLQWQLDLQHKYPQILLPAAPKVAPGTSQVSSSATSTGTISIGNTKPTMSSFPVTTINVLNQQLPSSSQQSSANSSNANIKPGVVPVTLAPKMPTEIAPKLVEASSSSDKTSETAPSSPEKSSPSFRTISLSNINEWKVNDLKAELKKRSLPVSGSKVQLVDRLKAAVAKDENGDKTSVPSVKMEVSHDESSSEPMMEEESGGGNTVGNKQISPTPTAPSTPAATPATVVIPTTAPENGNNISFLDLNGVPISLQNILSLLGVSRLSTSDGTTILVNNNNNPSTENNLKNVISPAPAVTTTNTKIINQLPTFSAKPAAGILKNETSRGSNFVDEKKLLEQKKLLLEELSKQELQKVTQPKDVNNQQGIQQILQQHIQKKQREQAIQNQLHNLIQLQNQQAEQQKKQLQQQQQAQLVLLSSDGSTAGGNPSVSIANNVLPVTIVNSQQSTSEHQRESQNQHWVQNQLQQKEENHTSSNISFDDLVENIQAKDIPKMEPQPVSGDSGHMKKSVKSQMVDDVLEILIRNGELPPSAAQDPHHKTPSPPTNNDIVQPPPPPPPLPPPTFSVMLPTSIPFSRHQHASASDFLTFGRFGKRTDENLSKDAQAILKISEDLSNFGKTREAEAAAAAAAAKLDSNSNGNAGSSSMDCGIFTDNHKDYDLSLVGISSSASDPMDVGFADSHSVPVRNYSSGSSSKPAVSANLFQNSSPFDSGFSFGQSHHQSLKSQSDGQDHHQNHFMNDDELLAPVTLDMQMDTDYSDWLDTLLPESAVNTSSATSSSTTNSTNVFHQNQTDSNNEALKTNMGKAVLFNHNNNNSGSNGSIFGTLINNHLQHSADSDPHGLTSRDPLLSSTRGFCTRNNALPFGDGVQQQNTFLFSNQHSNSVHNHHHGSSLFFGNPSSLGSTSSTATLMDTDFDELTGPGCTNLMNAKIKSENNLCASSSNSFGDMPSTTSHNPTSQTPITTSSINDNFLWDFAM